MWSPNSFSTIEPTQLNDRAMCESIVVAGHGIEDCRVGSWRIHSTQFDECLWRRRLHPSAQLSELNSGVAFAPTHDVNKGVVARAFGQLGRRASS